MRMQRIFCRFVRSVVHSFRNLFFFFCWFVLSADFCVAVVRDHFTISQNYYGAHQSPFYFENETNSQHQRCVAKIYHLKWSHTISFASLVCYGCVCVCAVGLDVFNAYEIRTRCAMHRRILQYFAQEFNAAEPPTPPNPHSLSLCSIHSRAVHPMGGNGGRLWWLVARRRAGRKASGQAGSIGNLIYPPRHVSMCAYMWDARLRILHMHFVQFFVRLAGALTLHSHIKYAKWKSPAQKTVLQRA